MRIYTRLALVTALAMMIVVFQNCGESMAPRPDLQQLKVASTSPSAALTHAGVCGAAGGLQLAAAPAGSALCQQGVASAVTTTASSFLWSCASPDGGSMANCEAPLAVGAVNGACGSANAVATDVAPTGAALCQAGIASAVSGSGPFAWSCGGVSGGSSASCSAPKAVVSVSGICGNANGQSLTSAPSTGLCQQGYPTSITGVGPWVWMCQGVNGGNVASCSATQAFASVNAVCGAADGTSRSDAPSGDLLCARGTATNVAGAGPWSWACMGTSGGSSAGCTATINVAQLAVNGTCGSVANQALMSAPATSLCSTGFPSAVSGSGPWSWTCAGSSGGTTSACSAQMGVLAVNGMCGSASGMQLTTPPSGSALCTNGAASTVSGTGPWNWACYGFGSGGLPAACTASAAIPAQ